MLGLLAFLWPVLFLALPPFGELALSFKWTLLLPLPAALWEEGEEGEEGEEEEGEENSCAERSGVAGGRAGGSRYRLLVSVLSPVLWMPRGSSWKCMEAEFGCDIIDGYAQKDVQRKCKRWVFGKEERCVCVRCVREGGVYGRMRRSIFILVFETDQWASLAIKRRLQDVAEPGNTGRTIGEEERKVEGKQAKTREER